MNLGVEGLQGCGGVGKPVYLSDTMPVDEKGGVRRDGESKNGTVQGVKGGTRFVPSHTHYCVLKSYGGPPRGGAGAIC